VGGGGLSMSHKQPRLANWAKPAALRQLYNVQLCHTHHTPRVPPGGVASAQPRALDLHMWVAPPLPP
jgi:hypothetical protein